MLTIILEQFKTGGVWDAKPYIARTYGYSAASESTGNVYDADSGRWVRVDAFGNVMYGIMLASYGISEEMAILASNAQTRDSGIADATDDKAISLGYEMVRRYSENVPDTAYEQMILENLSTEHPE